MTQYTPDTPCAQLTVAISTRDRPEILARCLDALLSGERLPAEIVVADQSRDERTRRVVERRQCGATTFIYLRHPGSGLGASQNLAFSNARCPVVAVTDDDCVPVPGWVAALEQVFVGSQVDVLSGRVLPLGPEESGRYPVATRSGSARLDFSRDAMPWGIGSGNNFAARRTWLERIGGNDERLGPGSPGLGGVDMDLFYRLLRSGARIRYEPQALVYHERTDRAGRMSRRWPYGYGMGACCSLWLRQGDYNAPRILGRWLLLRAARLTGAFRQRDWMRLQEETRVLGGTLAGLVYGLRAGSQTSGKN